MSAPRLTVITTRLPPALCGIGTYSWRLREHWPNEQSPVEFLELGQSANPARQLTETLERIGAGDVLLHYAGRAYQRLGLPFWMPRALSRWKKKFPRARLGIFFHEMPGRFPITSRHFWLGKGSEQIIRQLTTAADLIFTNTENHSAQLRKLSRRQDVHLLPVGSNIERAPAASESRAKTEFLIFGLPFGRWQTLQSFSAHIQRWQADGRLTRLHLVGPQDNEFSKRADSLIAEELLVRQGTLPSAQIAELLRRVGFALTNVSEETWAKSTTFMACAANACPVVIAGERVASMPLRSAVTANEVGTISEAELKRRTEELAQWYREHADWPIAATRLAAIWS